MSKPKQEPWRGTMAFAEQVLGDRLTEEHRRTMLDGAARTVRQGEAEAARKGITLAAADVDGMADLGMAMAFWKIQKTLRGSAAPSAGRRGGGEAGEGVGL